jgi:hypothetical protein
MPEHEPISEVEIKIIAIVRARVEYPFRVRKR